MTFLKKIFIIIILLSIISTLCMGYSFQNNDDLLSKEIDDAESFCIYKSIEHIFDLKDSSHFYLQSLYNSENIPQYILAYKENGGYIIFNRINGNIEEMSLMNKTKFTHYINDYCYYCGPGNYYIKETSNSYYNIITKKSISSQKLESIDNSFKAFHNTKNIRFKNIQEACKIYKSNYVNTRDDSYYFWITNSYSNDGLNASNIEYVNYYDILTSSYRYGQFKENINGSCIFVADSLLLKYYDYCINDSLVPDNLFVLSNGNFGNCTTIPQSWINTCQNVQILDYQTQQISEDMSITPKYTVYEALHNYLACLSGNTYFGQNDDGSEMREYSNKLQCTSFSYTYHPFSTTTDLNNFLQQSIYNDNPIRTTIYLDLNSNETHATITYGYAITNNNTYYIMHFGWDDFSFIFVPDYYLIKYAFSINNIVSPHNVSTQNGETTYHYSCNVPGCFATLNHNYTCMPYYHYCPCGETYSHTSCDAYIYEYTNSYIPTSIYEPELGHKANCEICATRVINHNDNIRKYPDWFSAVDSTHIPHYSYVNSTYHKKECKKCDYVYTNNERHTFLFRRCIFCGYHK